LKRRELIRHLEAMAARLSQGGSHTIYWNPKTGRREPVPRHSEIPDILARKICRALGIPEP